MQERNKIGNLLEVLDSFSPFILQESWDNSGLLLGEKNREFSQIYLSLEVDREVLNKAEENSVILTHHPLIFSSLKQLDFSAYPSSLLELAIKKNISLIAMHTNFDKTHFGKYVVEKVLGIKDFKQDNFVMHFSWDKDFESLGKHIKEKMNVKTLKVVQSKNPKCQNIALITGSGAGFIKNLKNIDCLITGDIKYHDAMEAIEKNMHLIDCGHYELERYFGEILDNILTNYGYKAIISNSQNPFKFI